MGNDARTAKGGAGAAIYYLKSVNREELGQGVFGYAKQYDGMAVFLNTILTAEEGDDYLNFV